MYKKFINFVLIPDVVDGKKVVTSFLKTIESKG